MSEPTPETSSTEKSNLGHKPQVHDGFWYEKSKQFIEDSDKKTIASAEKLEKLILWLWGIYTSIIGLGAGGLSAFAKIEIHWIAIFIFLLPSILLLWAYWFVTMSMSIVPSNFDPRDVVGIKKAYKDATIEKTKRYNCAKYTTLFACGLIPILIFSTAVLNSYKVDFQAHKSSIPSKPEKTIISINGDFPSSKEFSIFIYNLKDMSIVYPPVKYSTVQKAKLQTSVEVDTNKINGDLGVAIEWEEDVFTRKTVVKVVK